MSYIETTPLAAYANRKNEYSSFFANIFYKT